MSPGVARPTIPWQWYCWWPNARVVDFPKCLFKGRGFKEVQQGGEADIETPHEGCWKWTGD
ncbi:hypothetical protein CVT26_013747 [Gymnopilus dilepis]|uniref:Uncharacterized protein n=1 Tax=Gymnopilus dilepis TaxID=231916 RepID=A0A409X5R6_9AGAR|nr:hypothetical protein CVT26_013747 [Gymnopilus dilepis]